MYQKPSLRVNVKLLVELFKCSHTPPQVGVMFLLLMMWNTDIVSYFITFGSSQSTILTTSRQRDIAPITLFVVQLPVFLQSLV
jgi:hypothetical protein